MVGKLGQYKDGELWFRCPSCGDSQNDSSRCHASVNDYGLWHCLRCGSGGSLSTKEFLALLREHGVELLTHPSEISDTDSVDEVQAMLDSAIPGAAVSRRSSLDRYHLTSFRNQGPADIFLSRTPRGRTVGLAAVLYNTKKIVGTKAFGFAGPSLHSSLQDPLRLVEGPYDCVDDRHVCTYGIPNVGQLRDLLGHYVILCPDGDVWPDPRNGPRMTHLIESLKTGRTPGPFLVGIEILKPHEDPDTVPVAERHFIRLLA